MQAWGAVIVAAGQGKRMGTAESKQYLQLQGKPILVHTLEVFEQMAEVAEIALVVGEGDVQRCLAWRDQYGLAKLRHVVAGGAERQHSVALGAGALDSGLQWVMVHDGVRPLVCVEDIRTCCQAAEQSGAAVLAVPVKDTIKQVEGGLIEGTPDRSKLWAIQTPQAFRRELLEQAHRQAAMEGFLGTDDASLVERLGAAVAVAEGSYTNIKITTPEDLPWAELLLAQQAGRSG